MVVSPWDQTQVVRLGYRQFNLLIQLSGTVILSINLFLSDIQEILCVNGLQIFGLFSSLGKEQHASGESQPMLTFKYTENGH